MDWLLSKRQPRFVADCGKPPLVAGVVSWVHDSVCCCSSGSVHLSVLFDDYFGKKKKRDLLVNGIHPLSCKRFEMHSKNSIADNRQRCS